MSCSRMQHFLQLGAQWLTFHAPRNRAAILRHDLVDQPPNGDESSKLGDGAGVWRQGVGSHCYIYVVF